jgi:hypothetical protein
MAGRSIPEIQLPPKSPEDKLMQEIMGAVSTDDLPPELYARVRSRPKI